MGALAQALQREVPGMHLDRALSFVQQLGEEITADAFANPRTIHAALRNAGVDVTAQQATRVYQAAFGTGVGRMALSLHEAAPNLRLDHAFQVAQVAAPQTYTFTSAKEFGGYVRQVLAAHIQDKLPVTRGEANKAYNLIFNQTATGALARSLKVAVEDLTYEQSFAAAGRLAMQRHNWTTPEAFRKDVGRVLTELGIRHAPFTKEQAVNAYHDVFNAPVGQKAQALSQTMGRNVTFDQVFGMAARLDAHRGPFANAGAFHSTLNDALKAQGLPAAKLSVAQKVYHQLQGPVTHTLTAGSTYQFAGKP